MKTAADWQQAGIWAGIIGPPLFVAVFTLEGWLRPDYDPLRMYVSALSLGERGWVQIANFIVFGLLLLLFTRGVATAFRSGNASRSGLAILAIIATGYLISGPFVMDPDGIPAQQMTLHGLLHAIAGAIVFSLMPASFFIFLRRFREDPNWQPIQGWTLLLGMVCALAVVTLSVFSKPPDLKNSFDQWFGLIQRMAIMPFMLWILIFALRLKRVTVS